MRFFVVERSIGVAQSYLLYMDTDHFGLQMFCLSDLVSASFCEFVNHHR